MGNEVLKNGNGIEIMPNSLNCVCDVLVGIESERVHFVTNTSMLGGLNNFASKCMYDR